MTASPDCSAAALATLLGALDGLPQDELPDVLGLLEAAKARCWARLTAPPPAPRPHDPGRTLTVREAAGRHPRMVSRDLRVAEKLGLIECVDRKFVPGQRGMTWRVLREKYTPPKVDP